MLLFLGLVLWRKPTRPCPRQHPFLFLADGQRIDHDVRLLQRRQFNLRFGCRFGIGARSCRRLTTLQGIPTLAILLIRMEFQSFRDDLCLLGQIRHHVVIRVSSWIAGRDLTPFGTGGTRPDGLSVGARVCRGSRRGFGNRQVRDRMRQRKGSWSRVTAIGTGAGSARRGTFLCGTGRNRHIPETRILGQFLIRIMILIL